MKLTSSFISIRGTLNIALFKEFVELHLTYSRDQGCQVWPKQSAFSFSLFSSRNVELIISQTVLNRPYLQTKSRIASSTLQIKYMIDALIWDILFVIFSLPFHVKELLLRFRIKLDLGWIAIENNEQGASSKYQKRRFKIDKRNLLILYM
jgi:hypothetical protein